MGVKAQLALPRISTMTSTSDKALSFHCIYGICWPAPLATVVALKGASRKLARADAGMHLLLFCVREIASSGCT
jgi:hypothetical protein